MKKISLILLAVMLLGACKNMDFGDINQDPIGPNEPSPKDLLAGGMINFFNNTGRSYFTNPTFYVQWQAQNIYTSEMQYADSPIDWSPWYVQVLSNFKTNIDYVQENRNDPQFVSTHGNPDNVIGVNKIMMAYVFKFITDIYGDIPFSEALDPNNFAPKYDNQIDIYHGIIEMLKQGRDMMDPSNGRVKGDFVYGGDVTKWKKFANSLIMNAALQLSNVPSEQTYAQGEFNAALSHPAGVIENLDDEIWVYYSDQHRALFNPFSRLRYGDYALTKEFTDALQGQPKGSISSCSPSYNQTFDTRDVIFNWGYFDPGMSTEGKTYSCNLQGGDAQMSILIWNATAPLPFFTAAWTYLDRAEAAARGWTTEDFDDMLTNAIEKSYASLSAQYGLDITASAAAFAAARVADANDANYGDAAGDATRAKLRVVAEEKWVAYFPMGFQGWTQWRRLSEYMPLVPHPNPLNATGQVPRRYKYPINEPTFNPNGYNSGVQGLTPAEDRNDSRIRWDQ